jgi:nucleotide-binding universal stress UspA family protein
VTKSERRRGRLERWVVGFDGSSTSIHAVRWSLANMHDRVETLTAVRAWASPLGGPDPPVPRSVVLAAHQRDLEALLHTSAPGVDNVTAEVRYGQPAAVLLDASESASLLIVGNRGHGGVRRKLLGSVSLACVTNSRIPVIVVPPEATLDGQRRHIVVGFDGSDNSRLALEWASAFVQENATIHVVAAGKTSGVPRSLTASRSADLYHARREEVDRAVAEAIETSPVAAHYRVRIERRDPVEALLEHAVGADVLVVGARGRSEYGMAGSIRKAWVVHAWWTEPHTKGAGRPATAHIACAGSRRRCGRLPPSVTASRSRAG